VEGASENEASTTSLGRLAGRIFGATTSLERGKSASARPSLKARFGGGGGNAASPRGEIPRHWALERILLLMCTLGTTTLLELIECATARRSLKGLFGGRQRGHLARGAGTAV